MAPLTRIPMDDWEPLVDGTEGVADYVEDVYYSKFRKCHCRAPECPHTARHPLPWPRQGMPGLGRIIDESGVVARQELDFQRTPSQMIRMIPPSFTIEIPLAQARESDAFNALIRAVMEPQ